MEWTAEEWIVITRLKKKISGEKTSYAFNKYSLSALYV